MSDQKQILKTEEEWKKVLTPKQYKILREKGTEPAFSGKLLNEKRTGNYVCAACGSTLFSSDTKFDSGTGWPSFDDALPGAIKLSPDNSYGMQRTEVTCSRCGSHLGHLFEDLPAGKAGGLSKKGKRYCMNSVCLEFEEKK